MLIYQCFTCATPFEGPNAWATLDNIVRGRRVHDLAAADPPVELPESAASVINALLHPDPAMRLGGQLRSNEVRIHPFFWGFDWSQMEKRTMTPPAATAAPRASRSHPFAAAADGADVEAPGDRRPPLCRDLRGSGCGSSARLSSSSGARACR